MHRDETSLLPASAHRARARRVGGLSLGRLRLAGPRPSPSPPRRRRADDRHEALSRRRPQTTSTSTTTTPAQHRPYQPTGRRRAARTRPAPHPRRRSPSRKPCGEGPRRRRRSACSAKGYTANDTSEYHPNQTLRVLIGTRAAPATGYGQQAFFFVDGHYIGTDTKEPSADGQGRSPRATPKSRSPTRCTARAIRCAPQRRSGDRAVPAEQRQTHAARPDPAGELRRQ